MEQIIEMMEKYGGSFVKALAECYRRADPINARKLENTFREYFDEYKAFLMNVGKEGESCGA